MKRLVVRDGNHLKALAVKLMVQIKRIRPTARPNESNQYSYTSLLLRKCKLVWVTHLPSLRLYHFGSDGKTNYYLHLLTNIWMHTGRVIINFEAGAYFSNHAEGIGGRGRYSRPLDSYAYAQHSYIADQPKILQTPSHKASRDSSSIPGSPPHGEP